MKKQDPSHAYNAYIHQRLLNNEMTELYLPPDDIRRTYTRTIEAGLNQMDAKGFYEAMKPLCCDEKDIVFTLYVNFDNSSIQEPIYQEVRTLPAIANHYQARMRIMPDAVTTIKNTKFFCNTKTSECEIYSEFKMVASVIFELIWKNLESPNDIASAVFGLSALSSVSNAEDLDLSDNHTTNPSMELPATSGDISHTIETTKKRTREEKTALQRKKGRKKVESLLDSRPQELTDQHDNSKLIQSFTSLFESPPETKIGDVTVDPKIATVEMGYMRFMVSENDTHDIQNIVIANEKTEYSIGKTIPPQQLDFYGAMILELDKQNKLRKLKFIHFKN